MRIVLIALAVVLLVWLLRRAGRPEAPPPPTGTKNLPQAMVACVHCGLHLPRAEAVVAEEGVFCGEAHRLQHVQGEPPAS